MIVAYTKPTKLTHGNYGDVYKYINPPNVFFYVQISEDPLKNNWITLGEFFELALVNFIDNEAFINNLLKLINTNKTSGGDLIDQEISDKILGEIL